MRIESRLSQITNVQIGYMGGQDDKVTISPEQARAEVEGGLDSDEKLRKLLNGKWQGDYPSWSEADLACISYLALVTGGDRDEMDRRFRSSKLYRKKWDEMRGSKTYGEMTIDKALSRYTGSGLADKKTKSDQRQNQVGQLISLITQQPGTELFHDGSDCYISFRYKGILKTYRIDSEEFGIWISHQSYSARGKAPSKNTLNDTTSTLKGMALFDGISAKVHLRCAEHDGCYYIDIGDDGWLQIKISADRWEIISASESPVKFTRTASMLPLPIPDKNHGIEDIRSEFRKFINVKKEDIELLIVSALENLRPDTPYTITVLTGEPGRSKSTSHSNLRNMNDPNVVNLRVAALKVEDTFVSAARNYCCSYNNLSHLTQQQQDAFCCLATGGGYAARTLYTNTDETFVDIQRPVILNGINNPITASDLQDRAVVFETPEIAPHQRKTDSVLRKEFQEAWPKLLGALLDAFVKTLKELPNTHLDELPRMADFALLGEAASKALCWDVSFADIYSRKRDRAALQLIDSSPVITALLQYLDLPEITPLGVKPKKKREWDGTYQRLLNELNRYKPEDRRSAWPTSAKGLSHILKRFKQPLKALGVHIEPGLTPERDGYHVKIWRDK